MILMEALKIKLSKLLRQGRRVRILATTFRDDYTELQKKYVEKYLVNMKNVEVMGLSKLSRETLYTSKKKALKTSLLIFAMKI